MTVGTKLTPNAAVQNAINYACIKNGSLLNYVTIGTIEGNIASGQLTFGTFLSMSTILNLSWATQEHKSG